MSSLWPQPIEIIGITGEISSGKTLFLVSIAPGTATKVYDLEKSSSSFTNIGFDRTDVPEEMLKRFPKGYKPIDTFEWWLSDVRSIPKGKYKVIGIDPASEIESGLVDYVSKHPGEFGHTAGQYQSMSGLMWGDVKEYWKSILSDIAARCETLVFTVHMGQVFAGNKPVPGKRKPKGKDTLLELASLYLQLERKPDEKGNVPDAPSARVIKSRLANTHVVDGNVVIIPSLPPRLPRATPAAIRAYMAKPPDYAKLAKDERAPEERVSQDELAQMRLATAEAERDTELARLEQVRGNGAAPQQLVQETKQAPASPFQQQQPQQPIPPQPQQQEAPPTPKTPPQAEPIPMKPVAETDTGRINDEQSKILAKLITENGANPQDLCTRYHIRGLAQLPAMHFDDACFYLRTRPLNQIESRIDDLAVQLKIDPRAWNNRLVQLYKTTEVSKLTPQEKQDLVQRLENNLTAMKEAAQERKPEPVGAGS